MKIPEPIITPMTSIVESIRAECLRYKALAEGALNQISEAELVAQSPNGGNSIAVICQHISGNLRSRLASKGARKT